MPDGVVRSAYGQFTMLPNGILRSMVLSNDAKVLYMHLTDIAFSTQNDTMSRRDLATRMGKSPRTIDRYMTELVTFEAVSIEHRYDADGSQLPSIYTLEIVTEKKPTPLVKSDKGGKTDLTPPLDKSDNPNRRHIPSPKEEEKEATSRDDRAGQYFDQFWAAYPRKMAKGNAKEVWHQALSRANGAAHLLAGLQRYVAWLEKYPDQKQFIPDPKNWLVGERWDDELTERSASVTPLRPRGKTIHDIPEL